MKSSVLPVVVYACCPPPGSPLSAGPSPAAHGCGGTTGRTGCRAARSALGTAGCRCSTAAACRGARPSTRVAPRLALRLLGLCAAASCTYTTLEAFPAAAATADATAAAAGCLCPALPITTGRRSTSTVVAAAAAAGATPRPLCMSATATARGANARNMTETASVAARPRAVGRRPCRFSPLTSSRAAHSGGMPACPPRPGVQKEYPSVERKASIYEGARLPQCGHRCPPRVVRFYAFPPGVPRMCDPLPPRPPSPPPCQPQSAPPPSHSQRPPLDEVTPRVLSSVMWGGRCPARVLRLPQRMMEKNPRKRESADRAIRNRCSPRLNANSKDIDLVC